MIQIIYNYKINKTKKNNIEIKYIIYITYEINMKLLKKKR